MKLMDALHAGLIKLPLKSTHKVGVIQELLALLEDNGLIEHSEEVLEAILAREKIMSTGVGNGVAIPHCKTAYTRDFVIALGIHPQGVDFESLDNQPGRIIFLLIGPDSMPGTHIRLLSRISRIIAKKEVRDTILQCQSPEEIYQYLQSVENELFHVTTGN